ncbi:class I SAM-dependent methyltransferase [Alteromonas sp. CI.11.F.A3]|uniref:class I SAM-dependent methyltransferase n=1 Tax=Alteromonas sp. CI.11.F.A3 TaxID=3079555 RepID=UPI002943C365|nr:class I SAM-dependent methyltransferase [Alteromonas sp. CI.11.F.A3]WOI36647.1 class I SAM-dependent methyltransferase [Alteromonas sp. CI.11.F.A3]
MSHNVNESVWDKLYQQKQSLLKYPDSTFVTLLNRYTSVEAHPSVLDYGFGGGANMRVMLRRGHKVTGIEISDAVIEINQQILEDESLEAELFNINSDVLPFKDNSFSFINAWHVLGYNSMRSLDKRIQEFKRVLKPGGKMLGTVPAYGDVSHNSAKALNEHEFESQISSQKGAKILCFPCENSVKNIVDESIDIGLMQSPLLGETYSRHWVFHYEK